MRLGLACLLALLAGCAQLVPQTIGLRGDWPSDVPQRLELTDVPFFAQSDYQCGPAALAIAMNASGAQVTPDRLVDEVYLPARHGSLQVEMLAAPRRHGLVGWQLPASYTALLRELAAGHPVLVLQDTGFWPMSNWHYAVVVGFDYNAGELYLRSGETRRQALPFTVFELTWRRSGYWAMVTTPPGVIPATATQGSYLPALLAFERTATADASRLGWEGFLARWPDDLLASVALGNQYEAAGNPGKAEAVLRRAVAAHPASQEALNNLAQVLSDLGRNDEALTMIERAAATDGYFGKEVAATREGILRRSSR